MPNNNSEKPAPLRHRTGAAKSASKQQHSTQTRKILYRVGYNWNKGGRLKELRIRHLARKFLKIWIQNTFGQVLPHKAKSHYKGVILKRVFEAWKDEWWTSRREWSLTLRAQCHYKYFLYNQTFHRWRDFVILQREKNIRIQHAQSFADRQRLLRAWESWEDYTEVKRIKKQQLAMALQLNKHSTIKLTWSKWKNKMLHIQHLHVMEDEALKQQRLATQHKILLRWRDMHTVSCHDRLNELKAALHNNTRLKRKAFNQWVIYVSGRHTKHTTKVVGQNTNHLRLVKVYWTKWCQVLYEKWSEEVRLEAAGHLAVRICQRRVVNRWKAYVKLCHKKAENIQKAQEHFHHKLQRAAFGGLSRNVKLNKSKRLNNNVAVQHCHRITLGRFWRLWQERLEEAEDRSFQHLTEKAQIFYSISLSRSCFLVWRQKLAELRHMQTLTKQADMLFADHIVPHCFQSWFILTHQETIQKQRKVKAEQYNRQRQYSWVFYTWWGLSEKHKEQKMAEQMAIFHVEQVQMQKAWNLWKKQTEMRIKVQKKLDSSKHLYQQRLLQKAMTQWKDNITELRYKRNREIQAYHQGDLCILRWTVEKWKKFVQMQKAKKQKAEEMQEYHGKQLLKHSFTAWKNHNLQMHNIHAQADELYKQQTLKSMRRVVGMWHENAANSFEFRIKKQMAQNHNRHVLQLKVFSAWREATVDAVTKHHQQMAVLNSAQEAMNKGQLQHFFRKWHVKTKNDQTERLHLQRAEWHHDTTVLTKAFRAWENHHNHYQKYKVMKRQASFLLRLKTWQAFFDLWKIKLQHRRSEVRQTEHALWHWSLSLQAKVLNAWRRYVTEQHREREEVAHAAQLYRDGLLREGVSCILTYAAQMNDLTTSLTQHAQEQHTRRLQRVVRRCALKWKRKALGKKEKKTDVKGEQVKKSVSFFLPEVKGDSQEEGDQALMKMLLARLPRRQPRCSEELLNSPPRITRPESAELDTSVASFAVAPQSQKFSCSGAAPVTSTRRSPNNEAGLTFVSSEEPTQNLLLPPSAFMATIPPEDPRVEQSSQPLLPFTSRNSRVVDTVVDLTNELLGIKQDMTSYQQDKKQLRAWSKLRDVLQTWLQTSGQDDHAEKDSVSQELEELKNNIDQLTTKLSKQKPTILQHIERIQHLQVTLQAAYTINPK
ncbi:protein SFI1 homolog [Eucyclogobius newberryi]|uniref:protein SFI1 homolog n=1 Tax=Eucyclogobius newberryi TaxID=166745 RepID=UPI003B5C3290